MKRALVNPYDPRLNKCFACSDNNPIGLKLKFEESEDFVHARWTPQNQFQGYVNVLHGGIIATLLDEICAWCVNVKAGKAGVTSELKIKYLKPVFISGGEIEIRASIKENKERNVKLRSELYDSNGKLCAEAESDFFIYPDTIARKKFGFPGPDAFRQ